MFVQDVVFHFGCALLIYFIVLLPFCHHGVQKLARWKALEDDDPVPGQITFGVLSSAAHSSTTLKEQRRRLLEMKEYLLSEFAREDSAAHLALMDADPEDAAVVKQFISNRDAKGTPRTLGDVSKLVTEEAPGKGKFAKGESASRSFPFWLYMSLSVRDGTIAMLTISYATIAVLIVAFAIFACLYLFLHLQYIHVLVGSIFVSYMLGLVMAVMVTNSTRRNWTSDDSHHIEGSRRSYHMEDYLAVSLQFMLIFIAYGFSRIVFDVSMWDTYARYAVILLIAFVLFFTAITTVGALLFPEFLMVIAMPPYIDKQDVKRLASAAPVLETTSPR
mmetsp:Transcript_112954/g.258708  ORF Transcript_112954/g.258708 Transcript_112954/m.258708 type:complete len:332 (+) Transcript_112954:64-1059(+)